MPGGIDPAQLRALLNLAKEAARVRRDLERSGVFESIDRAREALEPVLRQFPALNLSELHRVCRALEAAEHFDRNVRPRLDSIGRNLARIGWVGLENHLPEKDYFALGDLLAAKGNQAVDRYLTRAIRANRHRALGQFSREWRQVPALHRRRRIARESLWAHRQGRYALSVPALFLLVDAVAAEIVASPRARGTAHVRKAAAGDFDGAESPLALAVGRVFYVTHARSASPRSTLNRHDVLHGRAIGYASEVTSCKVIMLLDALARVALMARSASMR